MSHPVVAGSGRREPPRTRRRGFAAAWDWWLERLGRPVDGASLGAFRIAVGAIMLLEAWSLIRPSASANGAVPLALYYTDPGRGMGFPYEAFGWLPVLPPWGMQLLVGILAAGSLGLMIGAWPRLAASMVFGAWGYFYAIESTRTYWMSYYYLELLVAFLLIWMPTGRALAWRPFQAGTGTAEARIPVWPLWILRGQLVITYFYAGWAKLTPDWLIDAQPVRYYLSKPHVLARLSHVLEPDLARRVLESDALAYFLAWGGTVFDLAVGGLLLWKRTRVLGIVSLLFFHTTNHTLLFQDIAWFPLLGILSSTIFFEPHWPRRCLAWFRASAGGKSRTFDAPPTRAFPVPRLGAAFAALWLGFHGLFPMRHVLIPGDVRVTFEGLSFSWRLKAEVYRAAPCQITVDDPGMFAPGTNGCSAVNWSAWHGAHEIFRDVDPESPRWAELPEILVLKGPVTGERILYNPYSGGGPIPGEAEVASRIRELWRATYGHEPKSIRKTLDRAELLGYFGQALRKNGYAVGERPNDVLAVLEAARRKDGFTPLMTPLRWVHPFGWLAGGRGSAPAFYLVEDESLFDFQRDQGFVLRRSAWRSGNHTRWRRGVTAVCAGNDPPEVILEVHASEAPMVLPRIYVLDSVEGTPSGTPKIIWNHRRDLSMSKSMHISTQPFLLRRYARHVADRWTLEFGRRPAVRASTAVSMNFRPTQPIVDPGADLAAVSSSLWSHAPWVMDLESPRIPR